MKLYADAGGLKSPSNHLILADLNRDVKWLNHLVQDARIREGHLTGAPLRVLGDSPRDYTAFYTGDRVLFDKNTTFSPSAKEPLPEKLLRAAVDPIRRVVAERLPDWARVFVEPEKKVQVRNGQLGTILAAAPQFSRILVGLDTGERVVVNLSKYAHLSLGYATTVFKSQSTTVDHVYAVIGGRMTDRESAYVAVSRGRLSTNLVVDRFIPSPDLASVEKEHPGQALQSLARQVEKSHKQVSAVALKWLANEQDRGGPSLAGPEHELGR